MARIPGHLGALHVPSASGNFSTEALAQRTGAVYHITNTTTRIARALGKDSVVGDFHIRDDLGTTFLPTSIIIPTAEFELDVTTYTAAPYEVFLSTSSRMDTLTNAGGFHTWSLDLGIEIADVTKFGEKWATHIALVKNWSATAEAYWEDENLMVDAGAGLRDMDDSPFVVSFVVKTDSADEYIRLVGLAIITGFGNTPAVTDVVRKTITFQGQGRLYYRRDAA